MNLGALIQAMPVGLPAGARVPEHRLRSVKSVLRRSCPGGSPQLRRNETVERVDRERKRDESVAVWRARILSNSRVSMATRGAPAFLAQEDRGSASLDPPFGLESRSRSG